MRILCGKILTLFTLSGKAICAGGEGAESLSEERYVEAVRETIVRSEVVIAEAWRSEKSFLSKRQRRYERNANETEASCRNRSRLE